MSYLTEENFEQVQAFLDQCKEDALQAFAVPTQADGLMMIVMELSARVIALEADVKWAHERIRKLEWSY